MHPGFPDAHFGLSEALSFPARYAHAGSTHHRATADHGYDLLDPSTLRVMLVNKTASKQAANFKLTDFAPSTASRYLPQGEALRPP